MLFSINFILYISIIFLMTNGKFHKGSLGAEQENTDKSEVKSSKVLLQSYGKQTRNRCQTLNFLFIA